MPPSLLPVSVDETVMVSLSTGDIDIGDGAVFASGGRSSASLRPCWCNPPSSLQSIPAISAIDKETNP